MKRPKVIVLRTAGTNCDNETAFAFNYVGANAELVHMNELLSKKKKLSSYHIMAIPGGFTYGDDLGAGKILANELRFKLKKALDKFLNETYAGDYEAKLIAEFDKLLPEQPPWK